MSKRPPKPLLSLPAQQALALYDQHLIQYQDLRPATQRNYLSDVRQFMAWYEQQQDCPFQIQQITTPTLTRYRTYLQQELQCQPATINRYLVSLKRYFAWLMTQALLQHNPAQPLKLVKEVEPTITSMGEQDEAHLVAAVHRSGQRRDIALIILMLHTGLRVGEVCALQWSHLVLQPRSGYLKVWGKHHKYREVPLNSTARRILNDLKNQAQEDLPTFVFTSRRTGDALTPRAIGFIVKKYAHQAGLPKLHPHDLHHRFGYRMAECTPLHRLAQIMGHDSLDTTLRYVQSTQQDLQSAVEKIAWE
jgi:integrase/recombinase XerC